MIRDTVKGIAITVVTVLIAFGLCESAVRLLGSAPEVFHVREGRFRLSRNPQIGYELVPNYQSDHAGPMVDFAEKSNSLGFRDREREKNKPAGTYRVLILGDSITQGWMITNREDIFTEVMENRLRAAGRKVEVLNFGVNGYNTRQEVETLREKGLQFDPDLVVVAYCVNDMALDSGGIRRDLEIRRDQQARIKIPRIMFKSALFRQVWAVLMTYSQKPLSADGPPQKESSRIVPEALADLKALSDRHGFRVLVAAFPFLTHLSGGFDPDFFNDLENMAGRHGFYMIDLSRTLSDAARQQDIMVDDLHPNSYGHRRVGEALADYVLVNILDSGGMEKAQRQVTSRP